MRPHKCPVCDGTGNVPYPPGSAAGIPGYGTACVPWPCHACSGTGVLWEIEVKPGPAIHPHGDPFVPQDYTEPRP